jgi:histidinol-phosphate/aromatic aminotransferase/cobyric acid decarboxylase-like protein
MSPQSIEQNFYEKFDADIVDEVAKITDRLDESEEERQYLLKKLQAFCEQVFPPDTPFTKHNN